MMKFCCFLLFYTLAFQAVAQPELRIGLHLSVPWSYQNADGTADGIEYQLVSRIFANAGYQVEFEFHSYSRLLKQFSDKKLDCASPVAIDIAGAHYTKPYLSFQDVVLSRAEKQFDIKQLTDLSGKRIVAYQQARQVLGADFANITTLANYVELADRELQLELLFNDRVDLVVGEQRVLLYLAAAVAPGQALQVHEIFAAKSYPAACWQPELVQLFNQGLQQLEQNGELEALLARFPQVPH